MKKTKRMLDYTITTSSILAKNGDQYIVELYNFPFKLRFADKSLFRQISNSLVRIAITSFINWKDRGANFKKNILPQADALSLIKTMQGKIVGFSLYAIGNSSAGTYVYTKYAGVDPAVNSLGISLYRNKGLMQQSRLSDLLSLNPDITAGCSASGEIHLGVDRVAQEMGWMVFPRSSVIPREIGLLATDIYCQVYGETNRDTINLKTLIKQSESPYQKGVITTDYLAKLKMKKNEGLIYLSIKPRILNKLVSNRSFNIEASHIGDEAMITVVS